MVQFSNSPSITFNLNSKIIDLDLIILIYMCLFGSQSHHTTNMLPSQQTNVPHNQNVYAIHKFNSYHSNYDLTFQNFIIFIDSSKHRFNILYSNYWIFFKVVVQYFTIICQTKLKNLRFTRFKIS